MNSDFFPKIISFLLLLSFIFVTGCSEQDHKGRNNTVFRYNESANITSLDPAFARDQANIWATHQLFSGLVQLNDRLEIIPCIAKSWEITDEGRIYSFHLRKDVFFHDNPAFSEKKGRRVIASDFVYSFRRVIDPKMASPGSWVFNSIEQQMGKDSFSAPDDSSFIIRLHKAFPPFLGLLTTIYCSAVPHEAIKYYGDEFRKNPVGTGPFKFKMWKEGVKLVLVKNPEYFEFEEDHRLPYLDAVAITFLPDKQSAFLEFIKGDLDFMSGIDPGYKDELLTPEGKMNPKYNSRFHLISQPYLNTEYLGFLVDTGSLITKQSPVKQIGIRKAINCCFDREKMIRFLRNNIGTPGINGIIPKGMPGFDSTQKYYHYDPALARKFLTEAGFPGGNGLPLLVLSATSEYLDICKYIQHQASETGIDLKIDINPPAALKEMKAQAKLPFFRASWIADYPDAESYLSLFCSGNFCPKGPNYTHFANSSYDRLYEKAMTAIDDSVRYSCYHQMEQLIMEDAAIVVLYYDQVLRFVQNNVTGLGNDPMNLLTLKHVKKL
ncbi:MAG: ABC transporter substrate-binding protein [Bacteroidetes bacterium]|nr:ABC transporter substrate-binding protein [Bacteroidota bacterium]